MTGTGSRTHAVAPRTAAQEVTSRSARRRHVVLRPEKGTVHTSLTAHMCVMSVAAVVACHACFVENLV